MNPAITFASLIRKYQGFVHFETFYALQYLGAVHTMDAEGWQITVQCQACIRYIITGINGNTKCAFVIERCRHFEDYKQICHNVTEDDIVTDYA